MDDYISGHDSRHATGQLRVCLVQVNLVCWLHVAMSSAAMRTPRKLQSPCAHHVATICRYFAMLYLSPLTTSDYASTGWERRTPAPRTFTRVSHGRCRSLLFGWSDPRSHLDLTSISRTRDTFKFLAPDTQLTQTKTHLQYSTQHSKATHGRRI